MRKCELNYVLVEVTPQLPNTLEVKYVIRVLEVTKADPNSIPRRVFPSERYPFSGNFCNSVLGRQLLCRR